MYQNTKRIVFLYSPEEDWGLWEGFAEYAALHEHWLLYNPLSFQFNANDTEVYNWLKKFKPDGLIVPNSRENLDQILDLNIPMVLHRNLNKKTGKWPVILGNGKKIGEMAATHLLRLGFHNFGCYVYGNHIPMQERAESFANTVQKAGFTVNDFNGSEFEVCNFHKSRPENLSLWNKELNLLADWLRSLPKPIAIMAGDDILSVNILMACRIANLLIPQQVAVIGINNTKTICETQIPKLSSIALGYHKAGYEAAKLLDDLIDGKQKAENQIIYIEPTNVIRRNSSDYLAINDPDVAKAMNFIHQSSVKLIQVTDVVEQTNLSQTVLQKRFKKAIGCTISQEIKRVCTDKIAELLLNSTLTVSEIALLVGFSDPDHISRYFRKMKGMTPSDYRKKYVTQSQNFDK
ncbi:MAG: substrate-binding domain-containing protein [Sedimentisphaeraceae bacterium JB056]